MDSLVRLRCSYSDRDKWYEAAGGSRAFSEWARKVLSGACEPDQPEANTAVKGAKPQAVSAAPAPGAKPKPKSLTGFCSKTKYPVSECLCPDCKEFRSK